MSAPAIARVVILDPADEHGMPAFDGTLDDAAQQLEPGTYDAAVGYDDGTEADVSLVITAPVPDAAEEAGRLLADVFSDQLTASGTGGHFNCGEAENVAHALILLGHPEAAATFLAGHAMGDDDPEDDADHLTIRSADDETAAARDYLAR